MGIIGRYLGILGAHFGNKCPIKILEIKKFKKYSQHDFRIRLFNDIGNAILPLDCFITTAAI
jgi:hypothetical protein